MVNSHGEVFGDQLLDPGVLDSGLKYWLDNSNEGEVLLVSMGSIAELKPNQLRCLARGESYRALLLSSPCVPLEWMIRPEICLTGVRTAGCKSVWCLRESEQLHIVRQVL